MEVVAGWRRQQGYRDADLHASSEDRALYESIGFAPTIEMPLTL
jgi:hypothetical protein